jgi:hypothetical protein
MNIQKYDCVTLLADTATLKKGTIAYVLLLKQFADVNYYGHLPPNVGAALLEFVCVFVHGELDEPGSTHIVNRYVLELTAKCIGHSIEEALVNLAGAYDEDDIGTLSIYEKPCFYLDRDDLVIDIDNLAAAIEVLNGCTARDDDEDDMVYGNVHLSNDGPQQLLQKRLDELNLLYTSVFGV